MEISAAAPEGPLVASGVDPLPGRASLRFGTALVVSLYLLLLANVARVPFLELGALKQAPIQLNDFVVGAIVLAGAVQAAHLRSLRLDRVAAWACGFAAVGGVSALLAVPRFDLGLFELSVSLAYLARWLLYFGLFVVVINFVRRADVALLRGTIENAILLFAAFGILQSIFLPGFAQIVFPDAVVGVDWDYQGRRLVSTFLDPNYAGMLIVVGLLLHISAIAFGDRVAGWRVALLLVALVLTASRSAALALVVGCVVIALVRGHARSVWRMAALGALTLLAMAPVVAGLLRDFDRISMGGSASHRVLSWLLALEVFADNPIIGVGYNTFGFVADQYSRVYYGAGAFGLDGGLLFVAVTTGVVGLLVYGGMLGSAVRRCRGIWTQSGRPAEERGLALGTGAATVALIVFSLFVNGLFYPFLLHVLWILWGLVFLLRNGVADAAGEPGVPERVSAAAPR